MIIKPKKENGFMVHILYFSLVFSYEGRSNQILSQLNEGEHIIISETTDSCTHCTETKPKRALCHTTAAPQHPHLKLHTQIKLAVSPF